eukprot:11596449-Alexandrium_andersonii.AAC.1
MSASLVGSEMCIRDRAPPPPASAISAAPPPASAAQAGGAAGAGATRGAAVPSPWAVGVRPPAGSESTCIGEAPPGAAASGSAAKLAVPPSAVE